MNEAGPAKPPDIAKFFDLYNTQVSTINTLWNIFIVVNLGMLGFIYKDSRMGENWKVKLCFTVGFHIFALANREAISKAQNILFEIKTYLHEFQSTDSPQFRRVLLAHDALHPGTIKKWHWAFTILVSLVIWTPEIARQISELSR